MAAGSSLFEFMLAQKAKEADYYRQQQDQQRIEQREDSKNRDSQWMELGKQDFDRRLKLAELEARMSGALGRPKPEVNRFDTAAQEAVNPNYMQGEWDAGKFQQEQNVKRYGIDSRNETSRYGMDLSSEDRGLERERKAVNDGLRNALAQGNLEEAKRWHDISERLGRGRIAASFAQAAAMRDYKRQNTLDEREVGGLEIPPGKVPSRQSATEMAKTVEKTQQALSDVEQMIDVYKRQGAEFGYGDDRATSMAARERLLLNVKELENLGVLQKLDVEELNRLLPNPNSARGVFDTSATQQSFDNFHKSLRERVAFRAQARNYAVPQGSRLSPASKLPYSWEEDTGDDDASAEEGEAHYHRPD